MLEEIKHKKRKRGRPKKRGPKPNYNKRRKKPPKPRKKWDNNSFDYKIIACSKKKQLQYIGKYNTLEDAYSKIKILTSEDVVFPKQITNHENKTEEVLFEYVVLERNKGGEIKGAEIRNEFGKIIEQKTTSDNWVIIDKFKYNIEETFRVWGYSNNDRKTFQWIYDNILLNEIPSFYDIRKVILFRNKILFKDDSGKLELIICKNTQESVRFYNLLNEWVKRDKLSNILFWGSADSNKSKKENIINDIMKLTGWNKLKVSKSISC